MVTFEIFDTENRPQQIHPLEAQKNRTHPLLANFEDENVDKVVSLYRNDSSARINQPSAATIEQLESLKIPDGPEIKEKEAKTSPQKDKDIESQRFDSEAQIDEKMDCNENLMRLNKFRDIKNIETKKQDSQSLSIYDPMYRVLSMKNKLNQNVKDPYIKISPQIQYKKKDMIEYGENDTLKKFMKSITKQKRNISPEPSPQPWFNQNITSESFEIGVITQRQTDNQQNYLEEVKERAKSTSLRLSKAQIKRDRLLQTKKKMDFMRLQKVLKYNMIRKITTEDYYGLNKFDHNGLREALNDVDQASFGNPTQSNAGKTGMNATNTTSSKFIEGDSHLNLTLPKLISVNNTPLRSPNRSSYKSPHSSFYDKTQQKRSMHSSIESGRSSRSVSKWDQAQFQKKFREEQRLHRQKEKH